MCASGLSWMQNNSFWANKPASYRSRVAWVPSIPLFSRHLNSCAHRDITTPMHADNWYEQICQRFVRCTQVKIWKSLAKTMPCRTERLRQLRFLNVPKRVNVSVSVWPECEWHQPTDYWFRPNPCNIHKFPAMPGNLVHIRHGRVSWNGKSVFGKHFSVKCSLHCAPAQKKQ